MWQIWSAQNLGNDINDEAYHRRRAFLSLKIHYNSFLKWPSIELSDLLLFSCGGDHSSNATYTVYRLDQQMRETHRKFCADFI